MSIERMKRLWVVTDRERLRPLLDALASLQSVHLIETPSPEGPPGEVSRRAADASSAELLIARLQHALEIFNAFDPPKRSLGETFLPLPVEMGESEFRQALEGLDPEALDDALTRLVDDHLAMSHRIEEIRIERDHLKLWEPFNPTAPKPFHDLAAVLGSLNPRSSRQEESCSEADGDVVVNVLGRARDNRALVQVVALKEHQAEFDETLRRCEIEPLPLTPGVSVRDMLAALAEELEGLEKRVSAITHEIRALAETRRRDVQAVLTHWETAREVLRAHELAVDTRHTVVVTGYVRAREADAVSREIRRLCPDAGVVCDDPAENEDVPVELRASRLFGPSTFLTRMFGLPPYRAMDPSPYIMFFFLVFFGFCFGDVVYGVLLLGVSWHIARKLRRYPSSASFFRLLSWAGLFTIVFGALMGSWAATLPEVLETQFGFSALNSVRKTLMIIDPMKDPVTLLLVALGVGVVSQFWGIFLAMKRDLRRGDVAGAVFDSGLWYITLPGFIMLSAGLFSPPVPAWVPRIGLWVFGVGALGLALTQGRKEKSIPGKVVTGVVSVYGVLGSYGVVSFLGDTLSYARLLALGLVTGVVGYSFNLIASLTKDIPIVGVACFILIVLVGHTLNFLISVLGGFVHSARLIFLEVFGRFYETGGRAFRPLGLSERVRVTE